MFLIINSIKSFFCNLFLDLKYSLPLPWTFNNIYCLSLGSYNYATIHFSQIRVKSECYLFLSSCLLDTFDFSIIIPNVTRLYLDDIDLSKRNLIQMLRGCDKLYLLSLYNNRLNYFPLNINLLNILPSLEYFDFGNSSEGLDYYKNRIFRPLWLNETYKKLHISLEDISINGLKIGDYDSKNEIEIFQLEDFIHPGKNGFYNLPDPVTINSSIYMRDFYESNSSDELDSSQCE